MKKIIFIVLAILVFGCGKEQRVVHKYEILLPTKDTMYVNAWDYELSTSSFTSRKTVKFYDTHFKNILTINDPVYIREIK